MRYFLVSYAHKKGFGRRLFGKTGPVDERAIFDWEKACLEGDGTACIIAISEIDGPVTAKPLT